MERSNLLCVIDADNLFRAVRAIYGTEYRVSYACIRDLLKSIHPEENIHMSLFTTIKANTNTQIGFISRIRMLGFEIHPFVGEIDKYTGEIIRSNLSKEIIEYIINFKYEDGTLPHTLTLATNNPIYADALTALAYQGVSIEVLFFGNQLTSRLRDINKKIQLGPEMLFKQQEPITVQ